MRTAAKITRRPRKKLARALLLRDAALKLVRRIGVWETLGGAQATGAGDMKFLSGGLGRLHISYRNTPFQNAPWADGLLRYRAAQLGLTVPQSLPYGLDVWAPKKVLNIEWDDKGNVALVSLRPGAWETELITLAKSEVPLDTLVVAQLAFEAERASQSQQLAQMSPPTKTRH